MNTTDIERLVIEETVCSIELEEILPKNSTMTVETFCQQLKSAEAYFRKHFNINKDLNIEFSYFYNCDDRFEIFFVNSREETDEEFEKRKAKLLNDFLKKEEKKKERKEKQVEREKKLLEKLKSKYE